MCMCLNSVNEETAAYLLYLVLPQAPGDITQEHVLDYYRKYFPKTKLIVGVRHPIRWFESLYSK
jgi:hypothetical protein